MLLKHLSMMPLMHLRVTNFTRLFGLDQSMMNSRWMANRPKLSKKPMRSNSLPLTTINKKIRSGSEMKKTLTTKASKETVKSQRKES